MVSHLTYDYTMLIGARRMQRPPIQNFDAPQTAEQFDVSRCDRIADTDGPSAGSRAGGTDAAGRREYHDLSGLFSQYTGGSGGAGSVLPHGAETYIGNPNSTHPAGQAAQAEMTRVTESIAGLLRVSPEEIIYTSGASESNNLALKGIVQVSRHIGRHVISTALEHSSVGGALSALQQQGCEVDLVDIRRNGTIDLEQLRELLRKDTVLVSVCAADSELGTVQPIREIGTILKEYPNCRFHVDATQAVGKAELVLDGVDTFHASTM